MSEKKEKSININCGDAYLLSDREGFFDQFDLISLNCGGMFASSKVYAALLKKGASINCGNSQICDINGEIALLDNGYTINDTMDYSGKFIVSVGDVVIEADGDTALKNITGGHFGGALFYPAKADMSIIIKITGNKVPYPGNAYLARGDKSLKELLNNVPKGKSHIWVYGGISALDGAQLQNAKDMGYTFTCHSLFTYESLNNEHGGLFETGERVLVPDGYEITSDIGLNTGQADLYGPKIYVRGDLTLEKKDAGCLNALESIIVKGKATIPASCVKEFKQIGKADEYELTSDTPTNELKINGYQSIGHDFLQAIINKGETLNIKVNGCLLLDENVVSEDIEAIESIKVNGCAIMHDAIQGAMSKKALKVNGMVSSIESISKNTGMTFPEILTKVQNMSLLEILGKLNGGSGEGSSNETNINMGLYILV